MVKINIKNKQMRKIIFTVVALLTANYSIANASLVDHKSTNRTALFHDSIPDTNLVKIKLALQNYYFSRLLKVIPGGVTFNSGIDRTEIERDAIQQFGEIGEKVIWDLLSLGYFGEFSKERDGSKLANWIYYKNKLNSKYPKELDIHTRNADAWLLFETVSDKKQLEMALSWSKNVIAENPIGNYYDTYGNLLYKIGRKNEAITVMEKALMLPLGGDGGSKDTIKGNLDKMKKGERTW